MKTIYLYGIAGAQDMYRVAAHTFVDPEKCTDLVRDIKLEAIWLKEFNPSVEQVYMISQRPGLARDYKNAWMRNSIESHAIFKDILEREGLKVI